MAKARFNGKAGGRKASVVALFAVSALIVALALAFGAYSVVCRVSFSIMGMEVPGAAFAAVAAFLGVRYFLSVVKMNRRLRESGGGFDWHNFIPEKSKTKKAEG